MPAWVILLPLMVHYGATVQVHLYPSTGSCLCPDNATYMCQADLTGSLLWKSIKFSEDLEYMNRAQPGDPRKLYNVTANLTRKITNEGEESLNLTSTLTVNNFEFNNTELTCNGSLFTGAGTLKRSSNDTLTICITGTSSGPANMSVEFSSTPVIATVQFHPPVYGAECVTDYIVEAVREGDSVVCNSIPNNQMTYTYTCPLSETNVTDYYFTAVAVTPGPDGMKYNGSSFIECRISSPENIKISDGVCGSTFLYDVTWDLQSDDSLLMERVIITWRKHQGVDRASVNYEEATTIQFHQLNINYSVVGPVELTVSFLSDVCSKENSVVFYVQHVITNVSFSAESGTLTLLSRDCFDSDYNFTVTVMYTVNSRKVTEEYPISPIIVVYLEDQREHIATINVTVIITEDSSGVIVDMYNGMYTAPVETVEPVEDENEGVSVVYITSGVSGGFAVLGGVIVLVAVMVAIINRNKHSKTLKEKTESSTEHELKMSGVHSATNTEANSTCQPVGPLYAELNTMPEKTTNHDKEVEAPRNPIYHVLEDPALKEQQNIPFAVEEEEHRTGSESMGRNQQVVDKMEKTKKKSSAIGLTYTEVEIRSNTQPPPQMDQKTEYADVWHK